MAAGDVTIHFDAGRDVKGIRMVAGEVQLDGSNPTPVDLSAYMGACLGGVVSLDASAPPGIDPSVVASSVSGAVLNIEAYKITATGDGTLIDSTNSTAIVNFFAWGTP